MPYSIKNPPEKIKDLPKKAKNVWVKAFNNAWKQYDGDEVIAYRVAWRAVKKAGYERKGNGWSKMKKRDGSGPRKDSYQKRNKKVGKRKEEGENCPEESKHADYKGKNVSLNKPFRTPEGPKKFSVYVKNKKGNVVKVNFGDPDMEIKRDDADRRKSFRARHNCSEKTDKTKPGYWSCKMWQKSKSVKQMTKAEGEITASTMDPSGSTVSKSFSGKKKKKEEDNKMKYKDKKSKKKDEKNSKMSSVKKGSVYKTKSGEKVKVHDIIKDEVVISGDDKKKKKVGVKAFLAMIGKNPDKKVSKKSEKGDDNMKKSKTSKFAEKEVVDKLKSIIKALRKKATNKKPDDELVFDVKSVSYLIDDLEDVVGSVSGMVEEEPDSEEEGDEESDEDSSEDKKKESDKKEEEDKKGEGDDKKKEEDEEEGKEKEDKDDKDEGDEEDGEEAEKKEGDEEVEDDKKKEEEEEDGDDEEESKFRELIKVCEGYQEEIKKAEKTMSKFKKTIKGLEEEKAQLNQELSKFKEESYNKLLNNVVQKVSKFKRLSKKEELDLKKHYIESKMSEPALEELGRMTEDKMFSKLSEPKQTTQPTELSNPGERSENDDSNNTDFSKMSNEDKLDALANLQAKRKGFVFE